MAGGTVRTDKAYLAAIWLESVFYGMNFVLFFSYLFIAKYKRKAPKVNMFILPAAIAMFCLSTVHVALGFQRLIQGFIYQRDEPGGPERYFSDISDPLAVSKILLHTVNSIIGDSIVVWRCYHVWGRNWWICTFPILLIIGSAVCGFNQGAMLAHARVIQSGFADEYKRWSGAEFGLTLATNVIVTLLIASRIWYLARQINSHLANPSFRYRRVLILVVESGAIYSSALVILIACYFSNSNGTYVVYDPIAQLTAIVPTMIIIIASLGLTSEDLNSQLASTATRTIPTFRVEAISTIGTIPGCDSEVGVNSSNCTNVTVTGDNKYNFPSKPEHDV